VFGVLVDEHAKEGYSVTYNFTVIGWNDANLNAVVDHGVVDANGHYQCSPDGVTFSDNFIFDHNDFHNTATALTSFFSFIQNNLFAGSKTVAMLPRGFGFSWFPGVDGFGNPVGDKHLLQMGYNLDHSEIFADGNKKYSKHYFKHVSPPNPPVPPGISHVDSGMVSWNTYTILKDNDRLDTYAFIELVSGIGGNDVGAIQPPFSILPSDSDSQCGATGSSGVVTENVVIENVPFKYAIPMLTGWDLEYLCTDHHVRDIGIWIDGWNYTGQTLMYSLSSVLHDNHNSPSIRSHKVTILGFRPVGFK
jgi:hypothetical protein